MFKLNINIEVNRDIEDTIECWSGCDVTLDTLNGFNENTIKNMVSHIYFTCNNVQYHQIQSLVYYYKCMDKCFGTNTFIKFGEGERNKWRFKIEVIIKEDPEWHDIISKRILTDGSKQVCNLKRTCKSKLIEMTRYKLFRDNDKIILPYKPISSQCYTSTSKVSKSNVSVANKSISLHSNSTTGNSLKRNASTLNKSSTKMGKYGFNGSVDKRPYHSDCEGEIFGGCKG